MTHAAPTEQSWSRSAKLTEFARVRDTVIRLEKSSREQLQLESETQHVFDFMRAELGRIKQSIAALSGVVDDELASLRSDVGALREEVGRISESASTVNALWPHKWPLGSRPAATHRSRSRPPAQG